MELIQEGFYMFVKHSAFNQGYKAGETWESLLTCPYERDTPEFQQWLSGHQVGRACKF